MVRLKLKYKRWTCRWGWDGDGWARVFVLRADRPSFL